MQLRQEVCRGAGRRDGHDPSIVLIQTTAGLGSGVVFDNQGDVVTNNHVAAVGASPIVVTPDGHSAPTTLLGAFPADDLAVLRVKGLLSARLVRRVQQARPRATSWRPSAILWGSRPP